MYIDHVDANGKGTRFCLNSDYADVAGKLDCGTVGNKTTPVYFANGVPQTCEQIKTETLTVNVNGTKAGSFNGSQPVTINIDTMSEEEVNNLMGDFLPRSAGEQYKLTGALGLPEGIMYGESLPETGFEGQLFFLAEDAGNPLLYVPEGGSTGHVLIKNSAVSGDYQWKELVALPKGGSTGQVLVKNSTTDGDASWKQADYLPLTGGTIRGGDIQLGTVDASSDDSGDLVYKYGNGQEKIRIWTQNEYTEYRGPEYRVYSKDGTALGAGHLWASGESITGAVWNDYAECRESDCEDFGYVLMENGDDTLSKTTERLSHFAGISSDTWGFSQGETDKAKTPIAVAGRVLAYPYQDRNNYKSGDCVCAAPGGTVDIMTREEVINWPDRIVGTVSCVPDYEEWGGGENADRPSVKVNGRIWIKVK